MSNLREVTEGLPAMVDPVQYGGVVEGVYKEERHIHEGVRFTGKSFASKCSIPDVERNTKIIAVCGVTDLISAGEQVGCASPTLDGWFLSDFYLFHHLFKDVASDQIWMTCLSPRYLVTKYSQYIHGDSSPNMIGSRRVVLDENMLNQVEDIRVTQPNDLLERFTSTLKEACREAAKEDRPVLVMIFAHGVHGSGAMIIGGTTEKPDFLLTMKLFMDKIGRPHLRRRLCLMTTSCFSGHWAINPDLKITSMAASAPFDQSLSWPASGTVNLRFCGSPFASGIADTLLKMTIEGFGTDDLDDYRRLPTYAGFVSVVADSIRLQDPRETSTNGGPQHSVHQPMFSAQNDEWEMAYTKRTGIPLNIFQSRWLLLKAVGARPSTPGGDYQSGPGEKLFTYDQLFSLVKVAAQIYFRSFPGMDHKSKNHGLHGILHRIVNNNDRTMSIRVLGALNEEISYRMNSVMLAATIYKNYLGITMVDCHEYDTDNSSLRGSGKWVWCYNLLCGYPLFDDPAAGHYYDKGLEYLACCLAISGWSQDQITIKLDGMVKYRYKGIKGTGVSIVPGTSRVINTINKLSLNRDRSIRQTLRSIGQGTSKRLRSLSPYKRRSMLPDEWTRETEDLTLEMGDINFRADE